MGSFEQYIKGYIEINKDNVNNKLHKSDTKSIDKDKEINYINNTKKSLTTNKKVNTMKKNNTLTNADITNNIYQLTEAVNKILSRLDSLESKKTVIKPLKSVAEEVKKDIKKVAKKVEQKNKRNPEIVKLQKKAKEMKEKMTKNQLAAYSRSWGKEWQRVNKTIDINDKEARSLAFAKGRIKCAKNAIKMF
ncbi:hypothetical protein [Pseudobutyrivibrio sp.]|jgi:hypothetical protein|uniref:hypothetical protein n=1 Tax=Pseudobutyrivibrio sp. TaxID=2014367 RepID=UPI0025D6CE11|nr:hypothetical protein [Pseudobutyrivibrio sp.]